MDVANPSADEVSSFNPVPRSHASPHSLSSGYLAFASRENTHHLCTAPKALAAVVYRPRRLWKDRVEENLRML